MNNLDRTSAATRFQVSHLCDLLGSYLPVESVRKIYDAYLFAAEAHEGQSRQSGESYIYHPLYVAYILGTMHMDANAIIAAILHDVMEDTPVSKEELIDQFGEEVANLVDGVSKLTHLKSKTRIEAQAENLRKMMLAMVKDLRVIIIKLADRLHNMRTISALPPHKRRRIARETLEIYAPIAQRLGIRSVRRELELLAFEALYPMRYRVLKNAVAAARGRRKELLANVETSLANRLAEYQLVARVTGREKNLYSLYRKMREKHISFREIHDVFAFRIIVDDVDACYRALGVVHNLYKPVPGCFKDYIAIPKANGYQSLHTILFGPHGVRIEVQIRSLEMDQVAESGIAAHWLYKEGENDTTQARAREWLKQILEMQQSAGSSLEFLENVKADLFPGEVYVFTPKGKILELPRGSCPVDFAYAVHSDIGNACVAAKIDRRLSPLSANLENGQTIEIITSPGGRPNPAWLNFVATAKARASIRHRLRQFERAEAATLGRRLLEKALTAAGETLEHISADRLSPVCEDLDVKDLEQLYVDIGLGNRLAPIVARRILAINDERDNQSDSSTPLVIQGNEGMLLTFAKCCYPVPGDPIVGILSTGRGLVIHRETCRNISELRSKPDRCIALQWASEPSGEFLAAVRVLGANQRGLLAELAARIADEDSNIDNVTFEEHDSMLTTMRFVFAVRDRVHLARVMRRLRSAPKVSKIARIR